MVCEKGEVMEVEELEVMSSGPSVHTSSRVPKARRQSRTLGLRFSQYSNSCSGNKLQATLTRYTFGLMQDHIASYPATYIHIACAGRSLGMMLSPHV